jgi:hypothetical protein
MSRSKVKLAYNGPASGDVPQRTVLGTWVSNRRMDFKRGKLTPEQVARLDAIGFVWSRR